MSLRTRWTAALAVVLALLLTACGGRQAVSPPPSVSAATPGPDVSQISDGTLVYTNLNGETAKAEVFARLTAAGVPQADVDALSAWVDDYNSVMADCPSFTLEPEFVACQAAAVDYGDYVDMNYAWFKAGEREDFDPLCRVAAYRLMRSFLSVEHPLSPDQWQCQTEAQWLYSDYDVFSTYALMDLTEEDQAAHFTLWDPVPVTGCASEAEVGQAVLDRWQDDGIRFSGGQVSLISIWEQSDNCVVNCHTAVLVEDAAGYLLFEKTNPQSPYQATKFSSLEQVKAYMLASLALSLAEYDDVPGVCAVLRNDQLL